MKSLTALTLILSIATTIALGAPTGNAAIVERSKGYTLTADEMGVYQLITPEVNDSIVSSRGLLFGMRGTVQENGSRFILSSGNRTFEMDSRDGSMWYADYARLWNVSTGTSLPSLAECKRVSDDFLVGADLLPASVQYVNTGGATATAFNGGTGSLLTKALYRQVNYQRTLEGRPVLGPGGQIAVMVGDGGSIIGFDWNWRAVQLHSTLPVISFDSLLGMYGLSEDDVANYSLHYYAGSDDEYQKFLFPVYDVKLRTQIGANESESFRALSATEFSPMVSITTPTDGSAYASGQAITFNCSVSNGQGPFTFLWSSSIDGNLSDSQLFSTSDLSAALKQGETVSHTVTIVVTDANGMTGTDSVQVTVRQPVNLTTAVIIGAAVIALVLLVLLRRKRGGVGALLFLLVLFTFFVIPPMVSAVSSPVTSSFDDEKSGYLPMSAYDEGVKEIGIEWVGVTANPALPNSGINSGGFMNWMCAYGGYTGVFNFGEQEAWEEDFKYTSIGGNDVAWIDAVDFAYYQDHGGPDGVAFSSMHDDQALYDTECKWGDGDLEWIVFDACSVLAWQNSDGKNVFERWGSAFQGLHMMCSFSTGSSNVQTRGYTFAYLLTGAWGLPICPIYSAWFQACAATQNSDCWSAVLYVTKSNDPWNPQLDDPINDHAHGFGYVSSDPIPAKWLVWIAMQC